MDNSIISLLHRATQRAELIFATHFESTWLTPRQYCVLEAVAKLHGCNQADLVAVTGVDRSTMAEIIRRMLKKGLLHRRRNKDDGRAYFIALSVAGSATLAKARPLMQKVDNEFADRLSDSQRRELVTLLKALNSTPDVD